MFTSQLKQFFFSVLQFFSSKKRLCAFEGHDQWVWWKNCACIFCLVFFPNQREKTIMAKKVSGKKIDVQLCKDTKPTNCCVWTFFPPDMAWKKMTQTWVINLIFLSRQTSDNALLENKLQFVHHTHFGGMSHLPTYTLKYDIPHFCAHKEYI